MCKVSSKSGGVPFQPLGDLTRNDPRIDRKGEKAPPSVSAVPRAKLTAVCVKGSYYTTSYRLASMQPLATTFHYTRKILNNCHWFVCSKKMMVM